MSAPCREPGVIPARVSSPCRFGKGTAVRSAAFARRFFITLVVGLIWLGPAWQRRRFLLGMAAWDSAALLVWLVDCRRLPQPGKLSVSRSWKEPVCQGEQAPVILEIENRSTIPLNAVIEDDAPHALAAIQPRLVLDIGPGARVRGSYFILPAARGDHQLGRAYLRVTTPLRFAERWLIADIEQRVRVYPHMPEPSRQAFYISRGRQRELERRRRLRLGLGREFDSLREFRQGDEPGDICWTATARRGRLITKTYQSERSQAVYLIVDAGRLMQARAFVGSGVEQAAAGTKLDRAVSSALTLAQVALGADDAVGLIAYGRRLQARLAPARGASQLRRLLDQLATIRGETPEANHARASHALLEKRQRRSLVIWLTDIAETAGTPEVIEAALRLAPHHLVLFAAIAQPDLNRTAVSPPETAEQMYRYAAAVEITTRRELQLRRLRQHGAMAFELAPGQLAVGLVNQYLFIKERGRV
ncbi:MAG: DUF58 domain-containing protein [Terriglobia bacterium]